MAESRNSWGGSGGLALSRIITESLEKIMLRLAHIDNHRAMPARTLQQVLETQTPQVLRKVPKEPEVPCKSSTPLEKCQGISAVLQPYTFPTKQTWDKRQIAQFKIPNKHHRQVLRLQCWTSVQMWGAVHEAKKASTLSMLTANHLY